MGIEDLLDRGLLLVGVDVPDFELAVERSNKEVVLVDLVEEGRVLVVVDFVANRLAPRLDIDVHDQNLLVVEA